MSVLVECYSVIVRRTAIEDRYPGGMAAYQADCPNSTFCADDHLARVGFMVTSDLNEYLVQVLARAGLAGTPTGLPEDLTISASAVAIVEPGRGPWHSCEWLEYSERPDGVSLCYLAGEPAGELAAPPGWLPEHSRTFSKLDELSKGDGATVTVYLGRAYGPK